MRLRDGRIVPTFVPQAILRQPLTVYGDGSQTRSFCYVSDLIEGIYRLLMSNEHEPVNIGNPHELTVLEFAHLINKITENPAGVIFEDKRIQGDPQTRQPDITKAKALLGWEPTVSIEDGLRSTIEHFRKELK
jgi:dTDP-glucose 4,6-dehydratase